MSHLNKIYVVCELSFFRLWYLKIYGGQFNGKRVYPSNSCVGQFKSKRLCSGTVQKKNGIFPQNISGTLKINTSLFQQNLSGTFPMKTPKRQIKL